MKTYQSPQKNRSAEWLTFLVGILSTGIIALFIKGVANKATLEQKFKSTSTTIPVDDAIISTQKILQNDREKKLGTGIPTEQQTTTTANPVAKTTVVPVSPKTTTSPATNTKSDRSTKTS